METIFYIVDSIDGDYANLRREDDAQEEPKLVARARNTGEQQAEV